MVAPNGDTREGRGSANGASIGRAAVLHPALRSEIANGRTPGSRLEEATGLALAISLDVVESEVVRLVERRPATLFGKGTVERIGRFVLEAASAPAITTR